MRRAAVFAHFDKNNIVQDYVIYYLQELQKITDNIVFVSDSTLPETEINKIQQFVTCAIAKHHGEYDFGSYKYGYMYLVEHNLLADMDELLFVNDSCIGPLYSLSNVCSLMQDKDYDFWGISCHNLCHYHIQSFFLGFKKNVFTSEIFINFIKNIKHLETKDEIIKQYEIGLSKMLIENGFKPASLLSYPLGENLTKVQFFSTPNSPLIKKSSLVEIHSVLIQTILKKVYDKQAIQVINNYLNNNNIQGNIFHSLNILRKIFIRLHFKERRIYFIDRWYNFR